MFSDKLIFFPAHFLLVLFLFRILCVFDNDALLALFYFSGKLPWLL